MRIDLNKKFVNLKGEELKEDNENVAELLANILGTRAISDFTPVKAYDWARQLMTEKCIDIDRADRDKIVVILEGKELVDIAVLFRAQIILRLKEEVEPIAKVCLTDLIAEALS